MLMASVGDSLITFWIVMAIGLAFIIRMCKKFDGNGAVKGAAKKGAINMIGRLLK